MLYLFILFPVFFAGLWILVIFMISKMGWGSLAAKYHFDGPFIGERAGIISASFNGARYKNALILSYNYEGMYIKPVAVFRLFHKPILIPWKEIKEVRGRKVFYNAFKELVIGDSPVVIMGIKERVFSKLEDSLPKNLTRQKRSFGESQK